MKAIAKKVGVVNSKAGDPMAWILFDVYFPEGVKEMDWSGSFKGGAAEITVKALSVIGISSIDDLAYGRGHTIGKEVSVVIENEEYNGKTYQKIKWINEPNAKETLAASDAITKLKGMGLEALFVKNKKQTPQKEEIPF